MKFTVESPPLHKIDEAFTSAANCVGCWSVIFCAGDSQPLTSFTITEYSVLANAVIEAVVSPVFQR